MPHYQPRVSRCNHRNDAFGSTVEKSSLRLGFERRPPSVLIAIMPCATSLVTPQRRMRRWQAMSLGSEDLSDIAMWQLSANAV